MISRTDDQQRFADRIRTALDADLQSIDPGTLSKLALIRRNILHPKPAGFWWGQLVPAGAFASAVIAALVLLHNPISDGQPGDDAMFDLDLITAAEDFDMLENLDFYLWLQDDDMAS